MYKLSLVSYFDTETSERILQIQQNISTLTGSRACLDIWQPHITVGDGVLVKEDQLQDFYAQAKRIAGAASPFVIRVNGFGYLDNWVGEKGANFSPYSVYLKVRVTEEIKTLVIRIRNELTALREKFYEQPLPYTPHITVAYKDLDREGFIKSKDILSKKDLRFTTSINHFSCAQEDKEGVWQERKKFAFLL